MVYFYMRKSLVILLLLCFDVTADKHEFRSRIQRNNRITNGNGKNYYTKIWIMAKHCFIFRNEFYKIMVMGLGTQIWSIQMLGCYAKAIFKNQCQKERDPTYNDSEIKRLKMNSYSESFHVGSASFLEIHFNNKMIWATLNPHSWTCNLQAS